MVRVIPLSQGFRTIIDDEDFSKIQGRKWFAGRTNNGWVYAMANAGKRIAYMHRLIAGAKSSVIHLNGDGLDNRKSNLHARLNTSCRKKNHTYQGRPPTSQYKGICVNSDCGRRPFQAQIQANGQTINLGSFESQEEAARTYDCAALLLRHAPRLNFQTIDYDLLWQVELLLAARGIATRKPMEPQT